MCGGDAKVELDGRVLYWSAASEVTLLPKDPVAKETRQKYLDRIAKALARIEQLETFHIGKYVPVLGIKPTTPCVEVDDPRVRLATREFTVRNAIGERPEDAVLCHRCDNDRCIRGDHFFWGTHADNIRDCVLKGRHRAGGRVSKIPDPAEEVPRLRRLILHYRGILDTLV